ncbi:hypothetical protein L0663_19895 [Dyadobacter sp. CY107]|uniref:hypothetical protein n=1 Tax=Dyadobacter fanqingshengii TaxID=2906443 RepID=UPI001F27EB14|nr:hypothetical protein [Dyadobacter fanqingshengii]MCF2505667.1 hypothetical protein [Dyadobacter fanqingshengii]
MGKFLFKFVIFLSAGFVLGEIVVRAWHITSEVPKRYLDANNIQRYSPKQQGYWKGGNHSWATNNLGWTGTLPKSYENLVTVIGDSFIENFMNPTECHQDLLLKARVPEMNFVEAARSGVSFIEAMEIANSMDSLKPKLHLIYVNPTDFTESVREIKVHSDITQVDLTNKKVVPGIMKSARLKSMLYNVKFAYYLFQRFPLTDIKFNMVAHAPAKTARQPDHSNHIKMLMQFVKEKYNVQNKIIVFHPKLPDALKQEVQAAGFKTISLNSEGKGEWTFVYDHHWTCYGHKQAADQVSLYLQNWLRSNPL